jgi:hypothetical protein
MKYVRLITSSLQFEKNAAKLICPVHNFVAFLAHGNDDP